MLVSRQFTARGNDLGNAAAGGQSLPAAMAKAWPAPVRYMCGCVCLVVVVLSWVLEAELLQGLQEPGSSQYYNKACARTSLGGRAHG